MKFQITPENEQTKKEYKMERIILPEGNFDIGLLVTPFRILFTKEGKECFAVKISIIHKPYFYWLAQVNEERSKLLSDLVCEEEFNPRMDDFNRQWLRAKEIGNKIYKAAKAGRITKEFFNNQGFDAEWY